MSSLRLLALTVLASGCASIPAPVPMRSVLDAAPGGSAKCVVVFLPGAGDRAESFTKEGFVAMLREKHLSVDVIAADATTPYYYRGDIMERLEGDVMSAATERGAPELWLIGNSLGGHGSLAYPQRRPGTPKVDGVLALAPWLGSTTTTKEIRDAGGLAKWTPGAPDAEESYERALWRWLREVTVGGAPAPELWLGYGSSDRLSPDDGMLADVLPPERVFHDPGAHRWSTWRALFAQFLERSTFAQRCAP